MTSNQKAAAAGQNPTFGLWAPAWEYMVDTVHRSVLFWDVIRQRGNQYRERLAQSAPHVLDDEGGCPGW